MDKNTQDIFYLGARTIAPVLELASLFVAIGFTLSKLNNSSILLAALTAFIFCFSGEVSLFSGNGTDVGQHLSKRKITYPLAVMSTGLAMIVALMIISFVANADSQFSMISQPRIICISLVCLIILLFPRMLFELLVFISALKFARSSSQRRSGKIISDRITPMLVKLKQ